MAKPNPKLTLPDYVREIGTREFAERFGTSIRSAENYRYGVRRPKPDSEVTQRLLKETPLTYDGIYGPDVPRASY